MLSELAQEKLNKYQKWVNERDEKLKNQPSKEHEIISLYSPPINMLACEFANQVLEDNSSPHKA